ncbi:putative bicarbonate transporter [Helianthus annuus]|nr:putative bicarbonate transporter [Helianthus annuus]KAJ0568443.1 putative bicarbonate transporter [Helianthus annuus]KAJ0574767.1 putative bicarbonate transporter [Helianthus annuus]KAJ0739098.1 putative bicarbonate transporter [Helianthus annuus]
MVVVLTGVSDIPTDSVPEGIHRRPFSPNPWSPSAYTNWIVAKDILNVHWSFCSSHDDCGSLLF